MSMRVAIAAATLLSLAMFSLIAYTLFVGQFRPEGAVLWSLAWGKLSLADLYTGFVLFSGWIVFREASAVRSLICIALVLTLGNAFTALYVAIALGRSGGSWPRFWLGRHFVESQSRT